MTEDADRGPKVPAAPGWIVVALSVLAILGVAGLGYAWSDSNQLATAQRAFRTQMKAAQQEVAHRIADTNVKQAQTDAASNQLQSELGLVSKRLRFTQGELQKTRDEATRSRYEEDQELADLDQNLLRQLAAKASSDDLKAVNSGVTGVKNDLEGAKSDLKAARSELGTLIATEHDKIDPLRRMGDRDYLEFTIQGRGKPQPIGPMTVELCSVSPKRNRFSVALVMNDIRMDENGRSVNEPIIVYPPGAYEADELVVSSVAKNMIAGYISTPRRTEPATATSD